MEREVTITGRCPQFCLEEFAHRFVRRVDRLIRWKLRDILCSMFFISGFANYFYKFFHFWKTVTVRCCPMADTTRIKGKKRSSKAAIAGVSVTRIPSANRNMETVATTKVNPRKLRGFLVSKKISWQDLNEKKNTSVETQKKRRRLAIPGATLADILGSRVQSFSPQNFFERSS